MQVKQYVPEIMKAVVNLPEDKVCGAIGLCSSSLHGAAPSTPSSHLKRKSQHLQCSDLWPERCLHKWRPNCARVQPAAFWLLLHRGF